ncbi:MAG: PEPxxWA-CTERM sorting domain-containing protein, partial [Zoogloeaceae bacterium]|nr:PEPxxWA-CTERM sorting domain-containing protein [Zoogloeaceae bacterium]
VGWAISPTQMPLGNMRVGAHIVYNSNPAPAVPEPETYAMLLAGLGLVGLIARRRRNLARR